MFYLRSIFLICIYFLFTRCNDLAKRIVEESVKGSHISDSLKESREEFPISKDQEIVERKKVGDDSLFLVRSFFITKGKYSECWYKENQLHGLSKFYYRNGKLSHSCVYKKDMLLDMLESNFPDGSPRSDSKVKKGTGNVKLYHPITFKLYIDCDLKEGINTGKYISYYANGNVNENYVLLNDSAIGDYTVKYRSGIVKSQRREVKGKLTYTSFYPTGKPQKVEIWGNNKFQNAQVFDEKGNVSEKMWLEGDNLKSIKSFYGSKNLLLSRENYLNQKKQGSFEYFYEDGQKKALEEYDQDELLFEKRWHENGNLSLEASYKDGEYDGIYKDYYPNGKLQRKQHYVNGVKQGKYVSYFDNGNKYNEGNFVDGKPKGPVKVYTREGKFDRIKEY